MNPGNNNGPNGPFTYTNMPTRFVGQADIGTRLDFIRKTYALFFASVVVAIFGAGFALASGLAAAVANFMFVALIAWFISSIGARAVARTPVVQYVGLFGFTFFTGIVFAPLLYMYQTIAPGVVQQAGILTFIVFGSLTAYAFISKKDFNFLGGILFVALIALIVGGIANIFIGSSAIAFFSAWVALILFSGFVLYDTSRIMLRLDEGAYCVAAIELFVDFLNLFLALLRILGGRR